MVTRKPFLGLMGVLVLLLSLAVFSAGAAPAADHAPNAFAMQDSTVEPTTEPVVEPTSEPPPEPTTAPPEEPTSEPPPEPTSEPAQEPTAEPTLETPTEVPTEVPPTEVPSEEPTTEPTQDPGDPTPEPTVVPPTEEPTEPGEELSSFFISKLFCATIDETAEDPCVGRVPAAEGTTVWFEVTYLEDGWSDTFPVEIEEIEGFTFGSILIYDAPLGAYRITEIVPAGYEAFPVPLHDGQVAEGLSITIELGPVPEEEEAFFVNVPFGEEPPATTEPKPTAPDDGTAPPDVQPPDVTPDAKEPAKADGDEATVAALPDTGAGSTGNDAGWLLGLELTLAGLLVTAALIARRMSRR